MKDSMIDMMLVMMPFMKPFMWGGVAIAALAVLLLVVKILTRSDSNAGIKWGARLIYTVSIFFILAQVAGIYLNMQPAINFGDSSKFEFILVSFWQISLAFFVVAIILSFLGKGKGGETKSDRNSLVTES